MRVHIALAAASLGVWLASCLLACAQAANPAQSVSEILAAGLELGVDEFSKHYGAPQPYAAPTDIEGPAKSLLLKIEKRRTSMVAAESELQAGGTAARVVINGMGLAAGTLGGNPLVGMAVADSVYKVMETTMIKPAIDEVHRRYDRDLTALVGSAMNGSADFQRLRDAASAGNVSEFKGISDEIYRNDKSFIDSGVLDNLPDAERRLVFERAVGKLFDTLKQSTDTRFELTGDEINRLKTRVSAVNRQVKELERKQERIQKALDEHIALTTQSLAQTNAAITGLQSDMRMVKETVVWQQLGTAQRIDALKSGWFPQYTKEEREKKIRQLESLHVVERFSGPLSTAGDITNGMIVAGQALGLDAPTMNALRNAKKNIDTAQAALGIAAQIAMGNYLGAFGAAGGLLGGGGGDAGAARHEELLAALGEISKKLDEIIDLQKKTLEAVDGIRRQIDTLANSLNWRLNSIEKAQFQTISMLIALEWQVFGSEDCRILINYLREFRGYDSRTHAFTNYELRRQYAAAEKFRLGRCRNFISAAVAPTSTDVVRSYFQLSPSAELLDGIKRVQSGTGLDQKSLEYLSRFTLYNAMRDYHAMIIPQEGSDVVKCRASLFHVLAATPIRFKAFDGKELKECTVAFKPIKRPGFLEFASGTMRSLDLPVIEEFFFIMEVNRRFRLFAEEGGPEAGLRSFADLGKTNNLARLAIIDEYQSFREILAIATVQQSMLSGSAVAIDAAKVLQAGGFGLASQSECSAVPEPNLFQAARCRARAVAAQSISALHDLHAQLAVAANAEEAALVSKKIDELRTKQRLLLLEEEKEPSKRSVSARLFGLLNDHDTKNECVLPSDEDQNKAAPELVAASRSPEGKEFWKLALVLCLMEKNPTFASNVVRVLVQRDLGSAGRSRSDYLSAIAVPSTTMMRGLLPNLPTSINRVQGVFQWHLLVSDVFGWEVDHQLPLASDVVEGSGAQDVELTSLETPGHITLTRLRNAVDNALLELTACTNDNEESRCDSGEVNVVRTIALGRRPVVRR